MQMSNMSGVDVRGFGNKLFIYKANTLQASYTDALYSFDYILRLLSLENTYPDTRL